MLHIKSSQKLLNIQQTAGRNLRQKLPVKELPENRSANHRRKEIDCELFRMPIAPPQQFERSGVK
jgi:hypothetical protein